GEGGADGGLAFALGAGVVGGGAGVGANGGDLNQSAHALGGAGLGDGAGRLDVQSLEGLLAGFIEDAHEVDGGAGALEGGGHILWMGDVAANGQDLPDVAEQTQLAGAAGSLDRDADAPSGLGQGAHSLGSDKAGTAEDRNQTGTRQGHVMLHRRTAPT